MEDSTNTKTGCLASERTSTALVASIRCRPYPRSAASESTRLAAISAQPRIAWKVKGLPKAAHPAA